MSSSPPVLLHKDLNLCLDITCFCSPLPAFGLIQFHPCFLLFIFFYLKLPVFLLSAIFGLVPVSYFSTAFSFPLSRSSRFCSFEPARTLIFAWLVVLLEPLCQQQRSFKELFMLHQNRNKHHTGLHSGSQMDTYILVSIKKGLLKIAMTVGF